MSYFPDFGSDHRDDGGWIEAVDEGSHYDLLEDLFELEPEEVDEWPDPREFLDDGDSGFNPIADPDFAPPAGAALASEWQSFISEPLITMLRERNLNGTDAYYHVRGLTPHGQFPANADWGTVLAYSYQYFWLHHDEMLRVLKLESMQRLEAKRMTVVDVGCGPCTGLSAFATRFGRRPAHYVGYDHSNEMRALARHILFPAGDGISYESSANAIVGGLEAMVESAVASAGNVDACMVLISHLFKNSGCSRADAGSIAKSVVDLHSAFDGRMTLVVVDVSRTPPTGDMYLEFADVLQKAIPSLTASELWLHMESQRFPRLMGGRWKYISPKSPKLVRILEA